MQPATALHRHRSSLEGIIDFSRKPPLSQAQYQSASRRFRRLIGYFDSLPLSSENESKDEFDRVKLVQLTFEYARSQESQGNFLRAFFESAGIPIDGDDDIALDEADQQAVIQDSINNFANHLFENFFLPRMPCPTPALLSPFFPKKRHHLLTLHTVKASTKKTPQPSPASHSAVQRAQGAEGQAFLGTPERLSNLRGLCLFRDRHRCVISRCFDEAEGLRRIGNARRQGGVPCDDDGVPLGQGPFDSLEVAHILPHSLTQV